jgi:hypothetical protein
MLKLIMSKEQVQHRMDGCPTEQECRDKQYSCVDCMICMFCYTRDKSNADTFKHCIYYVCQQCGN